MSIIDVYHHKGYGPGCLPGMVVVAPWGAVPGMILGAIGAGVYIWNSCAPTSFNIIDGIFEAIFRFMALGIGVPIGAFIGAFIGMLVNMIIVKIIDMNKTIKVGDKEIKIKDFLHTAFGKHVNSIKDLRKPDDYNDGDDIHFMIAMAISSMPPNAINPMTGKRYTSEEHADPGQVAAWFMDPNKMVYDYDLKMNVPYRKK